MTCEHDGHRGANAPSSQISTMCSMVLHKQNPNPCKCPKTITICLIADRKKSFFSFWIIFWERNAVNRCNGKRQVDMIVLPTIKEPEIDHKVKVYWKVSEKFPSASCHYVIFSPQPNVKTFFLHFFSAFYFLASPFSCLHKLKICVTTGRWKRT